MFVIRDKIHKMLERNYEHNLPAKKGLDKQCRSRSGCFPVCYSDRYFVNSNLITNTLFENRMRKMLGILEHLPLVLNILSVV